MRKKLWLTGLCQFIEMFLIFLVWLKDFVFVLFSGLYWNFHRLSGVKRFRIKVWEPIWFLQKLASVPFIFFSIFNSSAFFVFNNLKRQKPSAKASLLLKFQYLYLMLTFSLMVNLYFKIIWETPNLLVLRDFWNYFSTYFTECFYRTTEKVQSNGRDV